MANEFKKRRTAFKYSIGMILNGTPKIVDNKFQFQEINGIGVLRTNIVGNVVDKYVSDQKPYSNLTLDDGTGNIRIKAFADNAQTLMPFEIGDCIKIIGLIRFYNDEIYVVPELITNVDPQWLIVRKLELIKQFGQEAYENTKAQEIIKEEREEKELDQQIEQENYNSYLKNKDEKSKINPNEFLQSSLSSTNKPKIEQPDVEIEKIDFSSEKNIGGALENQEKNEDTSLKSTILQKLKDNDIYGGIDIDRLIMDLTAPVEDINKLILSFIEEGIIYEPRPGRIQLL